MASRSRRAPPSDRSRRSLELLNVRADCLELDLPEVGLHLREHRPLFFLDVLLDRLLQLGDDLGEMFRVARALDASDDLFGFCVLVLGLFGELLAVAQAFA